MLSEWMVTKCLVVLNEASDLYIDGPLGDATAGASMITIVVSFRRRTWGSDPARRWRDRYMNWDINTEFVRHQDSIEPFDDFRTLMIRDQFELIAQWMCSANDTLLGRRRKTKPCKVIW